jgi:hypothetical protein
MQGAQKLRSEAHLQVRRNNEVEAQRRRWTFYETIKDGSAKKLGNIPFGHSRGNGGLLFLISLQTPDSLRRGMMPFSRCIKIGL